MLLVGLAILFNCVGLLLLFDRFFLCLSSFLMIVGLYTLLGWRKFIKFFWARHKRVGTIAFYGGFFVILIGFSFVGYFIQIFGLYKLFVTFIPNLITYLDVTPASGLLKLPLLNYIANYFKHSPSNSQNLPL
ncbi:CGI-141 protein homolog, putative [Babesia microti strain RI]|uniref:CGI-141 protein homolog, putative n=1 Tax=Babesia microti (strain RI) TaxID=1133968 RepID=A0A1N6LWC1_BABMR|nr:CGI-141 protein homolog, putative [Babesia microti strain RI]SIO73174.1 CGI-141 protein homolog, putative [Babesia microti strain RI]|eukprot:XP_012647179.2 CGI-141 protein homolog, putative [Babesia microti strain RI]